MIERSQLYIGGQWVGSAGTKTLPVVNSTTEQVMATIPDGTAEDVDTAVAAAKLAFPAGARTSLDQRASYCPRIAAGLAERSDEIATVSSQEVGMVKPLSLIIQARLPYDSFASVADVLAQFR